MKVIPIDSPLPGEHLAATAPVMRPEPDDARWRVRLDFWPGRSLTAEALELEQENRAARLAWRGRAATPGVITGLEVALETPDGQATLDPVGHFIHVLPGQGVLADGEDIVVPRPLRVPLEQVPVHYVRARTRDDAGPDEALHPEATPGRRIETGGFVIDVDEFPAGHQAWAAVLVLCPAELNTFDRVDPEDPCELDPSRDAFADQRRLDAAILRLIQLPVRFESLPDLADRDSPAWRNRLVHAVLAEEASLAPHQELRRLQGQPEGDRWDTVVREAGVFSWERLGVPLALLSAELAPGAAGRSYFLDRGSVVRPGGRSRPRTRPAFRIATGESEVTLNPPGAGTHVGWRAAVDQFAEHLSLFPTATSEEIAAAAERFQFIPPAGFLPRPVLDLLTTAEAELLPPRANQPPDRAGVNHFFPASFAVEAVPVAVEDLDAALAASAPLAPYDLADTGDESVRVLVPLPQRLFDPHVLVVEQEDPIFAETVARFVAARQDWRQRRDAVAARRDTLRALGSGPLPVTPPLPLETGQLEPEPVETAASVGFASALISPPAGGPRDVTIGFAAARNIAAGTVLFLRLRLDQDAMPGRIEVRWQTSSGELTFAWTDPPPPPTERLDDDGAPAAVPLWMRFTVTGQQLGTTAESISGFTLHLEDGRIGLAQAGQLDAGEGPGELDEDIWWNAGETGSSQAFTGGDWGSVTGDQLLAPFEDLFLPVFPDGRTQDQRVAELETALNPAGVTPRATAMTVASHGIEQVIAQLELEASEADDFIDTNFTRAQVNVYRIRKLILGEQAAQKLLINPAIASIADSETATASAEQLGSFIAAAKARPVPFAQVNAVLTGPTAPTNIRIRDTAKPESVSRAGMLNPFIGAPSVGPVFVGPSLSPVLPIAPPFAAGPTIGTSFGQFAEVTTGPRFETVVEREESFARIDTGLKVDLGSEAARIDFKSGALKGVFGELPESGPILPPRGLSIGQRFVEPRATQNLAYARSALTLFLSQLPRMPLPLTGETVRSLTGQDVSLLQLQGRAIATAPATSESLRTAAITALLASAALTADTDEAEVTLAALDLTEIKSAILRTIERASQQQRRIVQTGLETLGLIRIQHDMAAGRAAAIEGKLAEARHDVSVARALRQEEQQRIAEINERRDALIAREVAFLAYVRPRSVDATRRNTPYWKVEPAGVAATLPACLRRHDEPPPPLAAYLELFRHAPARWFPALAPLLVRLDTPDKLIAVLDSARLSAASVARLDATSALRGSSNAVQFTVLGAQQAISAVRQRTSLIQVDSTRVGRWQDFQRATAEHASVGDLIAGRHRAADVTKAAAEELDQIGRVATCLHAEFAAVTPAIRLAWIERFSEFDRPGLLRDLTVLPQYGRLDRNTRRRLQEFADWLFGRATASERDAVLLINDLVRLCLLLASHAPVNRIIAGHVPRPTPVRPGLQIPIRPLNPELVRVGMEFHVWDAAHVVARGRVEDLLGGEVSARVDMVDARTTTLDTSMRVQFVAQPLSLIR